jgi:hypothetical protein
MIPSVGRIVHYTFKNMQQEVVTRPAIIVRVWGEGDEVTELTAVQLQVFTDGQNDGLDNVIWKTSVQQSLTAVKEGYWQEPKRV